MKRFALLLTATLAFTACAPALQTVQNERATLTATAEAVTFQNAANTAAEAPVIYIRGAGLEVTAKPEGAEVCHKRQTPGAWVCYFGDTPANTARAVTVTAGSVQTGSVSFYRAASAARPIVLYLK